MVIIYACIFNPVVNMRYPAVEDEVVYQSYITYRQKPASYLLQDWSAHMDIYGKQMVAHEFTT